MLIPLKLYKQLRQQVPITVAKTANKTPTLAKDG
jgi:hypothetical protein